ncbi:hypothetical protein UY3_02192 [Chelonia mydas]|uniref:Uncharacterized protein n=1 Tax=Chelonia mydas TaxID=8469 RepID=M7CI11_CHEMY|nr:hypothetical protein UY3_02192 [Chelonia mydas]
MAESGVNCTSANHSFPDLQLELALVQLYQWLATNCCSWDKIVSAAKALAADNVLATLSSRPAVGKASFLQETTPYSLPVSQSFVLKLEPLLSFPAESTDSQLRPDIVVTDKAQKKIILVDITISFENRTPAFCEARARKLEKYAPLADTLRAKGYEVQMDALIVGALGAWDTCNERVLRTCRIGQCYAQLMRRLMVSDTIQWSRDIYIEHITGHQQYQEA